MSTLIVVDRPSGETRNEAIARRLRGELAQINVSGSEVARRTGMTQAAVSRRLTGRTEFTVGELDLICTVIGLSFDYITTGIRAIPTDPNSGSHFHFRAYALDCPQSSVPACPTKASQKRETRPTFDSGARSFGSRLWLVQHGDVDHQGDGQHQDDDAGHAGPAVDVGAH